MENEKASIEDKFRLVLLIIIFLLYFWIDNPIFN
jgi:hypothetical protein